jgi:DNA-binding CsgD family transcriptional regulator
MIPLQKDSGFDGKQSNPADGELSPREIATLRELSLGKSNKEISAALAISVETVKYHLKNIQLKLGVSNRVSTVVKAIRTSVIQMPEVCADEKIRSPRCG